MHISLVNLSRQIQVWDLYGKNTTVSHQEAVFASPLQVQPPLPPRGVGSNSSLLCFVELPWESRFLLPEKMFLAFSQAKGAISWIQPTDWKLNHTTQIPLEK